MSPIPFIGTAAPFPLRPDGAERIIYEAPPIPGPVYSYSRDRMAELCWRQNVTYLSKAGIANTPAGRVTRDVLRRYAEAWSRADANTPRMRTLKDRQARFGRALDLGITAPLVVASINADIGYGCFAGVDLKAGRFLGEYTGLISCLEFVDANSRYVISCQPSADEDPLLKVLSELNVDEEPFSTDPMRASLAIDARRYGNETRFINHAPKDTFVLVGKSVVDACNATALCMFHDGSWRTFLIARRDIGRGEEIRFDYGQNYCDSFGFEDKGEVYALADGKVVTVETA